MKLTLDLLKKLIKEEFEAEKKQIIAEAAPEKKTQTDEELMRSLRTAATVGFNNFVVFIGNNSDRIAQSDALKQRITEQFKGVMSKYGARKQDAKVIFAKNNLQWPDWLTEQKKYVDERLLAEQWIRGTITGVGDDDDNGEES